MGTLLTIVYASEKAVKALQTLLHDTITDLIVNWHLGH